jgi:hypothetical protein
MNKVAARCLRSAILVLSAILQFHAGSALLAATNCTPAPSGLVGWWQAEGNANDFFGLNNGSVINGAGFAPGKVGQAFAFTTNGEAVILPNKPSLNPTRGLTIEGWVYVTLFNPSGTFLLVGKDSWSDWSRRQYQLAIQKLGNGWVFRSNVTGSTGDNWLWGPTQVQLDTWYHVAMTYDGSVSTLYVNGAFETNTPVIGPIHVDVEPLRMGGYGEGPWDLGGFLDEVSLYNRALAPQEIAAIYNAGSFGKCAVPVPPAILVQPTDQTVGLGGTVSFAATVEGSPPLAYQWLFAGNIIPGATLPTLTLASVQLAQAGTYALLVTNAYGSVLSSNAVLTVSTNCAPVPSGLVSWWPGNGSATDIVGPNNGTFIDPNFVPGEVGPSFSFNGSDSAVRVPASPSLDVGAGDGLTIEAWINPVNSAQEQDLVEWNNGTGFIGTHMTISVPYGIGGPGSLWANFIDGGGNPHQVTSAAGLLRSNVFQHVAATYDQASGAAVLYLNGQVIAQTNIGSFTPYTSSDMYVGWRPSGPFTPLRFTGAIDELSLYNRALSLNEIAAIYNASNLGKCVAPTPPAFVAQPVDQTTGLGGTVTFAATVEGTPPLTYQWLFAGTSIPGATSPSLTLNNVRLAQAGTYALLVTNVYGSVLSSNALLTVSTNCAPVPSGLVSWWQAEGNADDFDGFNNGSLINGAGFAPGKVGQAFAFTTNGQAVIVPNAPSLNPTNALTIEGWVYVNAFVAIDASTLVAKNSPSDWSKWQYQLAIQKLGSGWIFRSGVGVPSGDYWLWGSTQVQLNTWYHVATTYDGSALTLYVNGAFETNTPVSGPIHVDTEPLRMGGFGLGPWDLAGLLDEVGLYNRALTPQEIAAIYNAGSFGKCVAPTAPAILAQPTDQTVGLGGTVSIEASVGGTPPLAYQWLFDGTSLPGATSPTLTLTNVRLSQGGTYALLVTNAYGSVLSSNAVLTVSTNCAPVPAGIVSWWPGNESAADIVGPNNGNFFNLSYAPGEVGPAFSFNGTNSYVEVPNSPGLDLTSQLTIECWVKRVRVNPFIAEYLVERGGDWTGGSQNYALQIHQGDNGICFSWAGGYALGGSITDTTSFHHVAAVAVNGAADPILYIDGVQQAITGGTGGPINLVNSSRPLHIGAQIDPYSGWYYYSQTVIDEVSIYNRALSASEIQAIHIAGSNGKCTTPTPPSIYLQPANQTVVAGQSTTFTVGASGTFPLSFQWFFGGTALPGATNPSLTLSNVQFSQAGTYSVTITNGLGAITSSNAQLTVVFPPATVEVTSLSNAPSGTSITVPVLLLANGNENGLGFSLSFAPALLRLAGAALGSGASGASLVINTNQIGSGILGIAIALPADAKWSAGTQDVLDVTFAAAIVTNATTAAISFSAQPVLTQLVDVSGNPLAANFVGGTIALSAAGLEGDVWPHANGDDTLTISDWVVEGRYVARLDSPASGSEFQRADCAPRSTLGDGQITVMDWVQVGRYVAGLDPVTVAGGPTNEITPGPISLPNSPEPKLVGRRLLVTSGSVFSGQAGVISVDLVSQGNENALGFSVDYDPSLVALAAVSPGANAAAATFNINTNHAGRVGVALALPAGTSFPAGTHELLRLNFKSVSTNTTTTTSALSLSDLPVLRQVSDSRATALAAIYSNGSINLNPPPRLNILQSATHITLAWPLWATNFSLQEAKGSPFAFWSNIHTMPISTNNQNLITLPLGPGPNFYRLSK